MRLNYAGSGILARQIIQGAPADIFVAAHPGWMQSVAEAGRLQGVAVPLMSNRLVVIGPADAPDLTKENLSELRRIAVGFVNAVPAGQYAKAALTHLDLWELLASRTVQTDNARAALALVARGEVPFGIVYASDALAEPKVRAVYTFAPNTHPKIVYEAGLIRGAAASLEGLTSHRAQSSFARHGFVRL